MSTTYTKESAAKALAATENPEQAQLLMQQIAAETGWPIIEDYLIPELNKWIAADSSGYRVTVEANSAEEAAQEYVDGGEWVDTTETTWISVRVWREGIDSDGDIVRVDEDSHKITLEPTEPECEDGQEHDWQAPHGIVGGIKENPGVYGHGGGVTIQELCVRCGCGKLMDTWAQDPTDGGQGMTLVSYQPGKYTVGREE